MSDRLLNKFVEVFKPHLVTRTLQPKIEVDFLVFSGEYQAEFRKKWEELLAVIDPAVIEKREWHDYGSGYKYEIVNITLDGVKVELKGAQYDAPTKREGREYNLSQQERADQQIDSMIAQSGLIWALQYASKSKIEMVTGIVMAATGQKQIGDDVVAKAAERVISLLKLAKDLKP